MRTKLLAILLASTFSVPAMASEWVVDPAQSVLTFSSVDNGKVFTGNFSSFAAKIEYDPTALETASVDITVPLSAMDAGNAERNSELVKEDWFNPRQFPDVRYVAKGFSASASEPTSLRTSGTLTIRDISQPLDLEFQLVPNGENAVTATGIARFNRTNFKLGLKDYPDASSVATDVTVNFLIVATRRN